MTRYFTQDHEWIEVSGTTGTVGITDYAQGQLGDITFVELPSAGSALKAKESVAVVDSVKAASDIYAPASGTVTELNEVLSDEPELVNTGAETDGWLFRLTLNDPGELAGLMDRAAYNAYVAGL
jgi:glycine cleavage system H protein